jgi:hypothetical protein
LKKKKVARKERKGITHLETLKTVDEHCVSVMREREREREREKILVFSLLSSRLWILSLRFSPCFLFSGFATWGHGFSSLEGTVTTIGLCKMIFPTHIPEGDVLKIRVSHVPHHI